jgi:hypothetical protein
MLDALLTEYQIRLVLNKDLKGFDLIPKEYDMQEARKEEGSKNEFVFSEKDLPGFRSSRNRYDKLREADALKKQDDGSKVDKPRRWWPRTIPSEFHLNPNPI